MRLSLHLLKYELLRLRWVLRLTWLPAMGTVAFFLVPKQEWGSLLHNMSLNDMSWFWSYAAAMLGLMALAAAMAGAKVGENPQKAFEATRPLRRRHVAGAAAMLLAVVVLPGAVAYGGILALAEFNFATVLAGAGQALGLLWGVALAVWAWARLWQAHGYVLLLALLGTALPTTLTLVLRSHMPEWLPVEYPPVDRVVPLLLAVCLPVLITGWLLRRQQPGVRQLLATLSGPLCFLLVWGGDMAWRRMFPGKMERMVFGSGGEVLTAAELEPQVRDFGPAVTMRLAAPDQGLQWEGSVARVSWRERSRVSGPVEPVPEWSDWQAANGSLYGGDGQVLLKNVSFDEGALAGCTQVDLRFQIKLQLAGLERVATGVRSGTKASGAGWWAKVEPDGVHWRITPGMGVFRVFADQPSNFGPIGRKFTKRLVSWFRDLRDDASEVSFSLPGASTDLYVQRQEECLRVIQVDGVKMEPPVPPKPEAEKPKPATPAVREKPAPPASREPFDQDTRFAVWQASAATVPAPDAGDEEVAYFAQSLSDWEERKLDGAVIALVRAQPRRFLEMAVRRETRRIRVKAAEVAIRYPGSGSARPVRSPAGWSGHRYVEVAGAVEQALVAGLPESMGDEVCRQLWEAPWLLGVVEARCWGEAARPWLLRSAAASGKPIPEKLLAFIRRYEDPGFNDAMRRSFSLNAATVSYWASMPGLVEELEEMIAKEWRPYPPHSRLPRKDWIVLRAAGFRPYLEWLLKKAAERHCPRQILEALRDSVLDAAGNPPPWPGPAAGSHSAAPKEFLDWCRGLTADDFTFDRQRRRFVRKPIATPPP